MLNSLRVNVESYIPQRNPYSYQGTAGFWNEEELHRAFAHPDVIEVDSQDGRRRSSLPMSHSSLGVGGAHGGLIQQAHSFTDLRPIPYTHEIATLKVTKVGLLNRKGTYESPFVSIQ